MPPVLDPSNSKVDGLAFVGLSLARLSARGHPATVTHQTAFDLDALQDRDYTHIFSTNDDGWLVGGGEPPESYKLTAPDSGHVEILRVGTYEPEWGGVEVSQIVQALTDGTILIPPMQVVPTAVVANPDAPPELEIRFDMRQGSDDKSLPINWQLHFVHNQLFRHFQFASRFCPGAFHSTILRKAEFRSPQHRQDYFDRCAQVIAGWSPTLLQHDPSNDTPNIQRLSDTPGGIYLFRDRNTITHYFGPNFCPPYSDEQVATIRQVLSEEWDEASRNWKSFDWKSVQE